MIGKLVKVVWRDPANDWPFFFVQEVDGDWLRLRGADYPDGSATHEGDCVFVHRSEIKQIEVCE